MDERYARGCLLGARDRSDPSTRRVASDRAGEQEPSMSTSAPDPVCYAFGEFELRPVQRQLLSGGRVLPIGARALDLLTALVERRDRMVSKGELMDIVWPGLVVEENNLQVQVSALRKLLGADAVVTNPGRGYQFAATLTEAPWPPPHAHLDDASRGTSAIGTPLVLPTPLIGREEDLQALRALILHRPIVTVVGAGGIGKTSLALAAANALRGEFRDGVWIVELAGELDTSVLAQTVARALRIPVSGASSAQEQLAEALASQQLLLVLDNCERVCQEAALLVQALCERAAGVRVLATSQEMLHAHAETLFRLAPLRAPEAGDASDPESFSAVRLFVERASRHQRDFALTPTNSAAVSEICRRLDGLPLAIELAAARVHLLGVRGLLERLDDRFRILTGGTHTAVPRHQTLAATIAWSHDLLDEDERRTLRRLGVFLGGFTLELAQAVVSDEDLSDWGVIDTLGALVDKSLVVSDPGDVQRYRLLESTRAYALERLEAAGERAALERRHALAVRNLLVRTDDERYADADKLTFEAMLRRLRPEYHNVCAAHDWALARQDEHALAIDLVANSVSLFHALGETGEAFERASRFVARREAAVDDLAWARFLTALGLLGDLCRMTSAELLRTGRTAADMFRAAGQPRRAARALYHVGWTQMCAGRYDDAEATAVEMEQMLAGPAPIWLRADVMNLRGVVCIHQGRFDIAVDRFIEQREMLKNVAGEPLLLRRTADNLCAALNCLGRHDEVIALAGAMKHASSAAALASFGYTELQLLHAQTMLGRLDDSCQTLQRAMPCWQRDGFLMFGCFEFAMYLAATGRHADAARLDGAGLADVERSGLTLSPVRAIARSRLLQVLGDAGIGPAALERWREEGRRLGPAEVAALCIDRGA
ncbi:ATP-binding protein [Scleromatobacter humisilvae]|uniref:Helix-turn-helix transcriptional regulator n=1 Tax=Scleromatobacter humisilvae TaxID=2897159 RepID=A0A9X1YEN5_9BURK|nr:winged helix-turn-helix domain-containing protein [Scleromatobacter humisilvae]MCK9684506.1 helix-turn-helix transcriptional regulator [Scleromatobacter humisilvae]